MGGKIRGDVGVLGIANHKILDRLRKNRHEIPCGEEQIELADDAAGPMELLGTVEDGGRVLACLEKLTENHRRVVYLAFFEDLPYSEIASILNCPEGTVKTRIHRGKAMLKQQMEERDRS